MAFLVHIDLDRYGHAVQWAGGCAAGIKLCCIGTGFVRKGFDHCIQVGVNRFHLRNRGFDDLGGGDRTIPRCHSDFGCIPLPKGAVVRHLV